MKKSDRPKLVCQCGATVPDTSKYRNRFTQRHPVKRPDAMSEHLRDVGLARARFSKAIEEKKS
jgi:hypothetical protein